MTAEAKHEHFLIRASGLSGRAADVYVQQVLVMVRALDVFKTTFALATQVRAGTGWTVIEPYDGSIGPCNGRGGPVGAGWSSPAVAASSNVVAWMGYSPGSLRQTGCHQTATEAGKTAMQLFVHELVHAVRAVTGNWMKGATIAEEEVIAILVTNIFASENSIDKMRKQHADWSRVVEGAAVHNQNYYRDNLAIVEKLNRQNQSLARNLARIDVPFNPVRLYYQRTQPGVW
jgi:hypothetical protein